MGKQIPIELKDHYAGRATTTTTIMRIRTKTGEVYGRTELDEDIRYDAAPVSPGAPGDDLGMILHSSMQGGFSTKVWEASGDLSVDNSEMSMAIDQSGLSKEKLLAGELDSAEFWLYRINYMDLSQGHEMLASGRLDAAHVQGQMGIQAMRSLTDLLNEPEYDAWSKACDKKFGIPTYKEGRQGCPKEWVWVEGEVTAVDGDDNARIFGSDVVAGDDVYRFGVVHWLTGPNAGKEMEVEQNTGGTFMLAADMAFGVSIFDTFKVREDCSHIYDDGTHGCLHHYGAADRNKYFGGYPDIPTADGGASMMPGAMINGRD